MIDISPAALLEGLAEECCELGQAALKLARVLRQENYTPATVTEGLAAMREEAGDVVCYLSEVYAHGIIGKKEVIEAAQDKLERWKERMR